MRYKGQLLEVHNYCLVVMHVVVVQVYATIGQVHS